MTPYLKSPNSQNLNPKQDTREQATKRTHERRHESTHELNSQIERRHKAAEPPYNTATTVMRDVNHANATVFSRYARSLSLSRIVHLAQCQPTDHIGIQHSSSDRHHLHRFTSSYPAAPSCALPRPTSCALLANKYIRCTLHARLDPIMPGARIRRARALRADLRTPMGSLRGAGPWMRRRQHWSRSGSRRRRYRGPRR